MRCTWRVVNPGKRFRDIIKKEAQLVKQEVTVLGPKPLHYTDLNTALRDSILTPGGMGQIEGYRLKFDPADADQGIFFIAADGTETQVAIVGRNKPGDLMFLVPDTLTAGDYTLEVRVVLRGRTDLQVGALSDPLTVT